MADLSAEVKAQWDAWAEQQYPEDPEAAARASLAAEAALTSGATAEVTVAYARDYAENPNRVAVATSPVVDPAWVSDSDHLRGEVGSLRQRTEQIGTQYGIVWNFLIDSSAGAEGSGPVSIEMRAVKFHGSIAEGDLVQVDSKWRPGAVLHIDKLWNRTMNSEFAAVATPKANAGRIVGFVALGFVALLAVSIIAVAVAIVGHLATNY